MVTNKTNIVNSGLLASFIYATFCFFEMSTIRTNVYLTHLFFIVWITIELFSNSKGTIFVLKKNRYVLFLIFLIYYFFTSAIATGLISSFNRFVVMLELFSPIYICDKYSRYPSYIRNSFLFSFLLVSMFNLPILINAMNTYGMGLRLIDDSQEGYLKNAFQWAYSWMLISIGLSYLLFNSTLRSTIKLNYLHKLLLSLFFFIGVFVVIRSLYMTAIVFLLIGIIVSFYYGKKRWLFKFFAIFVVMMFVFISYFFMIDIDIPFLNDDHNMVFSRMTEISHILQGDVDSAGDFTSRNDLSSNSLETFLSSPVIGVNHEISDFAFYKGTKIGGHSEWIDNLAKYGLFSILIIVFLFQSIKYSKYSLKPVFLIYFFIGFFNPTLQFVQIYVTFLFLPFLGRKCAEIGRCPI